MPNKKSTRSAIYFYMEDLRETLRKQGITFRNMFPDLLEYASPRWKALTPEQRAPYERRFKEWKAEKNASLVGKMDSKGNLLTETRRLAEESEQWQREMNVAIKTLVNAPGSLAGIGSLKFHVISFNIFCETDTGDVVPAEFGIVEFTINDGITKELHKFIDPKEIPSGYLFACKKTSNDTHQIPPERFDLANDNYEEMYQQILNFINPGRRQDVYPNIFCLPQEIQQYMKIFHWIHEGGYSRNRELVLETYDLSILVTHLQTFAADQISGIGYITPGLVMDELQKSIFDHTPNISCDFHEELDITKYCALSKAKRQVYLILDMLCEMYKVNLVPGKHLPESSNEFAASIITYPQISVRPVRNIITERRPLVEQPTTTIVHGVRSRFAADYDDTIVIPSAMKELSISSSHSPQAWSNKAAPHATPSFDLNKEDFPGLGSSKPTAGYAAAAAKPSGATWNPVATKPAEVKVAPPPSHGGVVDKDNIPLRLPHTRPRDMPRQTNVAGQGIGRGIARGVPRI